MLSSLKEFVSIRSAVIITSIGFGLLHLTVGIPFIFSLLFSIGGLFYALVVMKTNSIYPSIIFHFVINVGMVLSGLILWFYSNIPANIRDKIFQKRADSKELSPFIVGRKNVKRLFVITVRQSLIMGFDIGKAIPLRK